jgi:hypothetical protein
VILKDLKPSNIRVDAPTGLVHGFWNSLTSSARTAVPPGPGVHRRNTSLRGVGTDRRTISWKRGDFSISSHTKKKALSLMVPVCLELSASCAMELCSHTASICFPP